MVIDVLNLEITQNDTTICEGDSLVLALEGIGNNTNCFETTPSVINVMIIVQFN